MCTCLASIHRAYRRHTRARPFVAVAVAVAVARVVVVVVVVVSP
jgi:hypothetical protein|tara:strand:+ start:3075 stop:3206 length:132 start_codon:yes stop_codon:yes gene_type:complete